MEQTKNWFESFRHAGAIWEFVPGGAHVAYEMASVHSDFYFNTEIVGQTERLSHEVAVAFENLLKGMNIKPDRVVSYKADVADGSVFASQLACRLSVSDGFVDLGKSKLSFVPQGNEQVLMIADDIISGGSVAQAIKIIKASALHVLSPILTLGNLSGNHTIDGYQVVSLFERGVGRWNPEQCPLCKHGSPALKARTHWHEFSQSFR